MRSPLWVLELAEEFWSAAGEVEPFPRRLHAAIAWALPLTVVELPGLRLADAIGWLNHKHVARSAPSGPNRRLRGFLFAERGAGYAFLDADDAPAEKRFSLAHELAHFLRDYWRPRREAERRLGAGILEVLDGMRPPRPEERLHAILGRMTLGCHTHVLARDADPVVSVVEQEADRLACELLAPADVVLAGNGTDREALVRRLVGELELPQRQAEQYADWLVHQGGVSNAWTSRLKNSVAEASPRGNISGRPTG